MLGVIIVGCAVAVIAHQEYRYQCLLHQYHSLLEWIDAIGEMIGDRPRKED